MRIQIDGKIFNHDKIERDCELNISIDKDGEIILAFENEKVVFHCYCLELKKAIDALDI